VRSNRLCVALLSDLLDVVSNRKSLKRNAANSLLLLVCNIYTYGKWDISGDQ